MVCRTFLVPIVDDMNTTTLNLARLSHRRPRFQVFCMLRGCRLVFASKGRGQPSPLCAKGRRVPRGIPLLSSRGIEQGRIIPVFLGTESPGCSPPRVQKPHSPGEKTQQRHYSFSVSAIPVCGTRRDSCRVASSNRANRARSGRYQWRAEWLE